MAITVQQINLDKNIWAVNTGQHIAQAIIPDLQEFFGNIQTGGSPPTLPGTIPVNSITWDINTQATPASGFLGRSASSTETPWHQVRTNDNYALNINYPYATLNISGPALLFYDDNNNLFPDIRWLNAIYIQIAQAMGSYRESKFASNMHGYGTPYANAKVVLEKLSLNLTFDGISWSMEFKIWGKNAAEYIMNSMNKDINMATVHARKAQWYNFKINLLDNLLGDPLLENEESLGYSILPTKLSITWDFQKEEKWALNLTVAPFDANESNISYKYENDPPITLYQKLITKIDIDGYINPWKSNSNSLKDAQDIAKIIAQMGPHNEKSLHSLNKIQILFHGTNILNLVMPIVNSDQKSYPYVNFNTVNISPETNGVVTARLNGIVVHPFLFK